MRNFFPRSDSIATSESYLFPIPLEASRRGPYIRWGVFFIFLTLILIAILGDITVFFILLYSLTGLTLLTWLWTNINLRGLVIKRSFDNHAFLGQQVTVQLNIDNLGVWPILWVLIHEHLPVELSVPNFYRSITSFAPREQLRMEYHLSCRKRGYYSIGPLDVQTGDFWGLFEGRTFRFEPQRLVVYPRIVPLTHLGLHSQVPVGDLPSHRRLTEDPSRIFGVRPYIVGDSLRKVNWKTTAKTGSMQVKRFQSSIALDAHLFLNLDQSDYYLRGMFTAVETGITIVASLAVHLSERRQTVGLTVFGLDPLIESMAAHTIPLRKGRAHLMQLLELLARIQKASSSTSFMQVLQQSSAGLPWGTLLFVVTPSIMDEMFDVLLGLRRRGLQPVLVLNQPGRNFRVVQAQAKQIGVPCYRIERVKDMNIWRQEKYGPKWNEMRE